MTNYHITAAELHARIVADLRSYGRHFGHAIDDILDGADRLPLEQVIRMVLTRVELNARKRGVREAEAR